MENLTTKKNQNQHWKKNTYLGECGCRSKLKPMCIKHSTSHTCTKQEKEGVPWTKTTTVGNDGTRWT